MKVLFDARSLAKAYEENSQRIYLKEDRRLYVLFKIDQLTQETTATLYIVKEDKEFTAINQTNNMVINLNYLVRRLDEDSATETESNQPLLNNLKYLLGVFDDYDYFNLGAKAERQVISQARAELSQVKEAV